MKDRMHLAAIGIAMIFGAAALLKTGHGDIECYVVVVFGILLVGASVCLPRYWFFPSAALLLLAGCGQPPVPEPDSILRDIDPASSFTAPPALDDGAADAAGGAAPLDFFDLVYCAQTGGAYHDLHALINGTVPPDSPSSPEAKNLATTCTALLPVLNSVLARPHIGWTVPIPAPLVPRTTFADFTYLGALALPDIPEFAFGQLSDVAISPTGTVYVRHRGGIQALANPLPAPVSSKSIAALPVAQLAGPVMRMEDIFALSGRAKNLGGLEWQGGHLWVGMYEFYNTAGRDDPGILCVLDADLAQPRIRGPWRAGPAGVAWSQSALPVGTGWYEPKNLQRFHANKTHGRILRVDPSWASRHAPGMALACFRQRGAGAFGGQQGPGLYLVRPDPTTPSGADLGARVALFYPTAATAAGRWGPGYKNAERNDRVSAAWLPGAVLFGWAKGLGPSYYGPGPAEDPAKGWHAEPWEPRWYLYDPDQIAEVVRGERDPWDVQPYAEERPAWVWEQAADGHSGNFREQWFGGMSWDSGSGILYVLQPQVEGQSRTVLHLVGVTP